jgi:hypothetical protein
MFGVMRHVHTTSVNEVAQKKSRPMTVIEQLQHTWREQENCQVYVVGKGLFVSQEGLAMVKNGYRS